MNFTVKDIDLNINWRKFNTLCNKAAAENGTCSVTEYYNNVNCELANFNATLDMSRHAIIFESEAYFTLFILRWS